MFFLWLKIPGIEILCFMICCVISSSSFVSSFNSIHDALQEVLAIENSTSFTPKGPWDMATSAVNQPVSTSFNVYAAI